MFILWKTIAMKWTRRHELKFYGLHNHVSQWWLFSNRRMGNAMFILIKWSVMLIFFMLVKDVYKKYRDNKYYFKNFVIPKSLQDEGITDETIRSLILNRVAQIDSNYKWVQPNGMTQVLDNELGWEVNNQDADLQYSGISYNRLVKYIAGCFHSDNYINGQIIDDNRQLKIALSLSKVPTTAVFYATDSLSSYQKVVQLCIIAGNAIQYKLNPLKLAVSQYSDGNYLGCIKTLTENQNRFAEESFAQIYKLMGDAYKNANQIEAAKENYRKSIGIDPKYYYSYDQLCYIFFSEHLIDSARFYIARAPENDETRAAILNLKGSYYYYANNLDSSFFFFNEGRAIYPTHAEFSLNLGCLYSTINKFDSSSKYLDAYLHDFKYRDFYQTKLNVCAGFYSNADSQYARIQALLKKGVKTKYLYFAAGWLDNNEGFINDAKINFENALQLDPEFPEAQFYLANILLEIGDNVGAKRLFDKLIAREPNADFFKALGNAYSNQGLYQSALDQFIRVKESSDKYSARGFIMSKMQKRYDAEFNFTIADLLNPTNINNLLSFAEFRLNNGRLDDCEAMCSRVLELDSLNPKALFYLGQAYIASYRLGDAFVISQRLALRDSSASLILQGFIYENNFQSDTAANLFERAEQMGLKNLRAEYFLASYYMRSMRFKDAIRIFNGFIGVYPLTDWDYINLGKCYMETKQYGLAMEMDQRALNINRNCCIALNDWLACLKIQNIPYTTDFQFMNALKFSGCSVTTTKTDN